MIDLKKISKKLDSLIESETSESLTSWLTNRRNKELNKILGSGTFQSLNEPNENSQVTFKVNILIHTSENITSSSVEFLVAA